VNDALLAGAACLLIVLSRRQGWLHPATLFAGFWTVTLAARMFAPLRQADMTVTAALALGLGILAVSVPAIVGSRPETDGKDVRLGDRAVALWRLIVLTSGTGAAVTIGVYLFRDHITSYYSGADFGQLSATAIRAAQLEGDRGGPLTLLLSLAPLLGALGIYGGLRYSRWWYAATALALTAALQSPARIATLGLVATCATFYAYARPALRHDPEAPVARTRRSNHMLIMQLVAVGAAGLAYFTYTSSQLGKDVVAAVFVTGWTWPQWLLSPVQYLVGGTAGFSASAEVAHYGDPFDSTGHSVYLLVRLMGQRPNTLADFTLAPFPINVYTAFGDMYFDFGLIGVAVLSLLLGVLAQRSYRGHRVRLELAWVAAVLVNVLVSTGMAYRLFSLDVVALLVTGWLAFLWLRRSEQLRARRPGRQGSRSVAHRLQRALPAVLEGLPLRPRNHLRGHADRGEVLPAAGHHDGLYLPADQPHADGRGGVGLSVLMR
jgi:hypothetical protein